MARKLFLILFFLTATCSPAWTGERFVISFGLEQAGYPDAERLKGILYEAYKRIGMEIEFAKGSLQRDLEDACAHQTDATAYRTELGAKNQDTIVQVPVVIARSSYACFTLDPRLSIHNWDDLKTLRVGYVSDIRTIRLTAKAAGVSLVKANNFIHGFRMLQARRIDVFIAEDLFGQEVFNTYFKGTVSVSEPLFTADVFHYVNRKHAELVPKLAAAFRDMFRDGTMRRLFGKYHPMLPKTSEAE